MGDRIQQVEHGGCLEATQTPHFLVVWHGTQPIVRLPHKQAALATIVVSLGVLRNEIACKLRRLHASNIIDLLQQASAPSSAAFTECLQLRKNISDKCVNDIFEGGFLALNRTPGPQPLNPKPNSLNPKPYASSHWLNVEP